MDRMLIRYASVALGKNTRRMCVCVCNDLKMFVFYNFGGLVVGEEWAFYTNGSHQLVLVNQELCQVV